MSASRLPSRVRRLFVEQGIEAALNRQPPRNTKPRKFDGEQEAHLIALTCSQPPEGQARWTLRLLAERMVELDACRKHFLWNRAASTKKNELKPWLNKSWVIPPQANAEFVCCMEDVLDVYTRPYDPLYPVVCLDDVQQTID